MTTTTEHIWNNFNKELLSFIKKRVKDTDAANDLLQEVFIKIHLKLSTLSDSDKLTSWVYQVTRNTILDYYKKHKPSSDIPKDLLEVDDAVVWNDHFANCLKPHGWSK